MDVQGTPRLLLRSVPVQCSVSRVGCEKNILVYLHPLPGRPVRDVGVVYESVATVADVSNSGVIPGGRFFSGTPETSTEVVPVVIGGGVSSENREARQLVGGVL